MPSITSSRSIPPQALLEWARANLFFPTFTSHSPGNNHDEASRENHGVGERPQSEVVVTEAPQKKPADETRSLVLPSNEALGSLLHRADQGHNPWMLPLLTDKSGEVDQASMIKPGEPFLLTKGRISEKLGPERTGPI